MSKPFSLLKNERLLTNGVKVKTLWLIPDCVQFIVLLLKLPEKNVSNFDNLFFIKLTPNNDTASSVDDQHLFMSEGGREGVVSYRSMTIFH